MRARLGVWASLAFASLLLAQNDRGIITGTVTDPAGASVPGAVVAAENEATSAQYQSVATATGNYTLSQLPAGIYDLSVEVPGFSKFIQKGVRVFVAETARIDVSLRVGAASESITVQEDATLLKTQSAEQSSTISVEKLNDLPINFGAGGNSSAAGVRNALTLVTLVPSGTFSGYSSVRMNGSPINTFNIQLEGQEANNNRLMIRQDQVQPSVESLQEVSVQTSNFSPEYGQVAGGMFNYTVKSGTNQFHGSLFEYLVNEDLGAGIPFTDSGHGHLLRPPNRRHDFGGNFGGPVLIPKLYNGHSKTFFFFSYEEFYQRQGQTSLMTVPTLAMRNGDFGAARTTRGLGTDPSGRTIIENTIYDPASFQTVNGQVVTDPFPNNQIPPGRMDPVALKIQDLLPKATRSGILNNWDQTYTAITKEYIPTIKLDQYFKNSGKVSFYFSQYKGPHYNGLDGLDAPITRQRFIPTLTSTYRLNYDQPVTPTLLVHFGVGYLDHYNTDRNLPEVINYDAIAGLGLKGAVFGKGFPGINGLFSANGGGMALGVGVSNSQNIEVYKPTAVASASLVRNNHTLKAGADWRIDALTTGNAAGAAGSYNFSAAQTGLPYTQGQSLGGGSVGLPYASFLLGLVNTASIANPDDPQSRKPSWALYAQDNWKVTRKLTLDYGLRWDYQLPGDEIHQRVSAFSPTTPNPSAGGLLGATIYESSLPGSCKCTFTHPYTYAIGPRLGVAYQVLPKTIFRGGWGVTYSQTSGGEATIRSTLGTGGWNSLGFSNPTYGAPALLLKDGLTYSLADLYNTTLDPGVRPQPGQIQSPPALIDVNAARPPRLVQWNISLQREITKNLVLEAAYVGNRGAWWPANNLINLNAITPQRLAGFGLDINNANDRTLLNSALNSAAVQARGFKAPYAGFPATSTLAQSLRPYPQFGSIPVTGAPLGNTWYDSLQVKVTKRVSHGLDMLGTLVWQKELGTNEGNVNDVFNRPNQKTISSLSQPFVLVVAFNYQFLAIGPNRWMRAALRDWTFSGIVRYSSGIPILIPVSTNNLNSLLFQSTFANRVPGQPLFLKDLNCHCIDPNKDLVLNPAAWTQPAAGQFGTSAFYYNDYRYARMPNEQAAFGRIFRIREGMSFQIRAEFFNIFNRTYMNTPSSSNALATTGRNNLGQLISGFGYINPGSVADNPRNGQIVARFRF